MLPTRSTMTRSMRPVEASVAANPSAIASIAISTPTTPAMPATMTIEMPRRSGMVRTFIAVTAPTCCRTLAMINAPRAR